VVNVPINVFIPFDPTHEASQNEFKVMIVIILFGNVA